MDDALTDDATALFESITTTSLVDRAHSQIRALIIAGRLAPGEPLKDSVLAEQMGISRSPVREALRRLEQSGLVEKSANRSYRISLLAADDIPELAALRLADETLAVRTIVHGRTPLEPLEPYIAALVAAMGDAQAAAAADAAFHRAVVGLAGLPRLTARYDDLTDQIRLALLASDIETWGRGEMLVENHTMLVDALREALETGDARRVVRMWEVHVLAGMTADGILEPLS
ncbi:GntR family transcriptional regulator [Schumannella sp. 10F1B-5-1]|uniref:GntR family transcriptional regulator n=1 Tax=Schumannella sp. 10F1B-5-1 TaxID=2590780 RepID=UPI0011308C0C|nr:GntR family transcriptional regulator [Schumannella sp. 10F1B-5-1]TPW78312.1 GntR family transcriptional regulator [Schumannella sp. 10F1B-5-1]